MAGAATTYSGVWKLFKLQSKRVNVMAIALVAILGSTSYLLGVWQNSGATYAAISAASVFSAAPCDSASVATARASKFSDFTTHLDFTAHHAADDSFSFAPAVRHFPSCDAELSEYTPCEDVQRSLKFDRHRLIYRERHCPEKAELLKCLIPAPPGYRTPFQWPSSREFAWVANVPHMELAVEKAEQNWIRVDGEKFRFPGGGTMFPNGADAYIDDMNRLIPLGDGSIRTAIDTGCGVASWGAFLLPRNILAMSFAPRDSHEAQVQFALERGVPAMIGVMASNRLPYPSRAFDMAHCSPLPHPLASIWLIKFPPFCSSSNPDSAWYTKMEPCITPLPEVPGIKDIAGDGDPQLGQQYRYHNLLDMNANLAGFAAALADDPLWVMNTVPTAAKIDTLGVIYERGLIGTYQDWCEAMSTYPRTYDFLHADSLFTLYKERCDMEDILLEMDRILRPEGTVVIRDDVDIVAKVKSVTDGMRWDSQIVDHEDGPHLREKILLAMKTYWTAVAVDRGKSNAGS
ncbi:hypothetical protein HPP92_014624 [Vanilla planifolia]|uniref:Methyltransferase n=2 Tax=Vanilla planifolia TaxID=51239 RepID=A0A835UUZ2_VANPL|nr:hypothetical protein HPP92_014624 [Vanilla planifolia]